MVVLVVLEGVIGCGNSPLSSLLSLSLAPIFSLWPCAGQTKQTLVRLVQLRPAKEFSIPERLQQQTTTISEKINYL